MTRGAIHAVDENLFLVEGDWPDWPAVSLPGSAVVRSNDRLFLIDTGAGPHQRAAIQAIVASCDKPAELVLVNSGAHPGLVGNNDVLDTTPADARRHLMLPGAARRDFASALLETLSASGDDAGPTHAEVFERPAEMVQWVQTVVAAYPPVHPTAVTTTDLTDCRDTPWSPIGPTGWTGWRLGEELMAFQATAGSGRLAFYLPGPRTLLLPEELALAPLWPGSDVADVIRVGTHVLGLLDAGLIEVVGLGFGAPLGSDPAREAIEQLLHRARTFEVPATREQRETPDRTARTARRNRQIPQKRRRPAG